LKFKEEPARIKKRLLFPHIMELLKVPFSAGGLGKTKGTEKAPTAVVEELDKIFLSEDGVAPVFDIVDVEVDNANIEMSQANIAKAVENAPDNSIMVGGDHSITYPAFKAFSKKHPGAGLIVFDAHPDVQEDFSPPTHEDYLRVLISKGHLKPENIILIGLRAWSKEEKAFLYEKRIKQFHMHNMQEDYFDLIMEHARQWPAFYLSVDIDAVDPSMAPGTGYREPGGITS